MDSEDTLGRKSISFDYKLHVKTKGNKRKKSRITRDTSNSALKQFYRTK
jgi:hypothetical protein